MSTGSLQIEAFHALEHLQPHAEALFTLNVSSRRPSAFLTPEFFRIHAAHDEFAVEGARPLLLLAFDGARLAGFLPLRTRPGGRIEFLVTHTNDRPGLLAHPEDEAACARAFFDHLTQKVPGWTFLQLMEQDPSSPLFDPQIDRRRFAVRHYPNNPNSTLELKGDLDGWFKSLGSNLRQLVARNTRKLARVGKLEFLTSDDRRGGSLLLDHYVELERRSWKAGLDVGISRHPARIELFRELVSEGQAARPVFQFLLVDDVPVAAGLYLLFGNTQTQMEVAFDKAWAPYAPGNALFVLGIGDALERGARRVDLLGNYAYTKSRWLAEVTPTHAVQVYRRFSLAHLKSIAGDLRRRIAGAPKLQKDVDYNLVKPDEAQSEADLKASRAQAGKLSSDLAKHGVSCKRLSGEALARALPFGLDSKPSGAQKKRDEPRAVAV